MSFCEYERMRSKKDSFRHKANFYQARAKEHLHAGRFAQSHHYFGRFMKCQRILAAICAAEIERDLSDNLSFRLDGAPAPREEMTYA